MLPVGERGDVYDVSGIGRIGFAGGDKCAAVDGILHPCQIVYIVDPAPGQAELCFAAPVGRHDAERRSRRSCAVNVEIYVLRSACVARTVHSAQIENILAVADAADINADASVPGRRGCVDPSVGVVQGILDMPCPQRGNSACIYSIVVQNPGPCQRKRIGVGIGGRRHRYRARCAGRKRIRQAGGFYTKVFRIRRLSVLVRGDDTDRVVEAACQYAARIVICERREHGQFGTCAVRVQSVFAAADLGIRRPDPFSFGRPGGRSVDIEVLVFLAVMDADIVVGCALDGGPAQIQIAGTGVERVAVSGKLQIGIIGVGMRNRVIRDRIVGVVLPWIRRSENEAAAAAIATDKDAVFLHLREAVKPCGGRRGQIPGIPSGRGNVIGRCVESHIGRAGVICDGLAAPVA